MIEEAGPGRLVGDLGPITADLRLQDRGRMKVRILLEGMDNPLFSSKYNYGWWNTNQHTGHIKHEVGDRLDNSDTPVDPGFWEEKWSRFVTELSEYADDADGDTLPKSVEAKRIIDNTERVVVHPGETTEWEVLMSVNGSKKTLEFDQTDMSENSPAPLKEEFTRVFYKTPKIEEPEEWADIRERWQEIQQVRESVDFKDEDIILESFIDDLRARLTPVSDPSQMKNGAETAWFDADNERGVGNAEPGPIVWVKREAVEKVRDQLNESIGPAKLSKKLLSHGYTVTTSERRQLEGLKTRFWFFDADRLEINATDVHEPDQADTQREVEA